MKMLILTKKSYDLLEAEIEGMEYAELCAAAENYGFVYEVDEWGDTIVPAKQDLAEWLLWRVMDEGFYRLMNADAEIYEEPSVH